MLSTFFSALFQNTQRTLVGCQKWLYNEALMIVIQKKINNVLSVLRKTVFFCQTTIHEGMKKGYAELLTQFF